MPSLCMWTCSSWIMWGSPLETARNKVYMFAMSKKTNTTVLIAVQCFLHQSIKRTDRLSSPAGWCSGTPRAGSVGGLPPFSAGIRGWLWRTSWGANTFDISSLHLSTFPKPKGAAIRDCCVCGKCIYRSFTHKADQITDWSVLTEAGRTRQDMAVKDNNASRCYSRFSAQ